MAADVKTHLYEWSTTEGSNLPVGSTVVSTNLDDNLRMIQKVVRDLSAPTTLAAGATTDLGSKDETFITLTGTAATITALGTVSAGIYKWVVLNAAHTLTHNGTSLILPGAANITAASGDVGCFVSLGSGNWKCVSYTKANGGNVGTLTMVDGTVSAPGLSFANDLDTGFYSVSANKLGIAAGGVLIMGLGAGGTTLSSYTATSIEIAPAQAAANVTGPAVTITGAAGAGTNAAGGAVTASGGAAIGNGAGGAVSLVGGAGENGGDIVLTPGVGDTAVKAGLILLCDDAGNPVIGVNGTTGHLSVNPDAGTPTISSGAGGSPGIVGTDNAFKLTLGTTPTTSIVITFANAFLSSAPVVIAQYQSAAVACRAVSTTTNVTLTLASATEAHVIDVICIGTADANP